MRAGRIKPNRDVCGIDAAAYAPLQPVPERVRVTFPSGSTAASGDSLVVTAFSTTIGFYLSLNGATATPAALSGVSNVAEISYAATSTSTQIINSILAFTFDSGPLAGSPVSGYTDPAFTLSSGDLLIKWSTAGNQTDTTTYNAAGNARGTIAARVEEQGRP